MVSECEKCGEPVYTFYKMDNGEKYHTLEYHKKDCYNHRHDNLEFIDGRWIAPENNKQEVSVNSSQH